MTSDLDIGTANIVSALNWKVDASHHTKAFDGLGNVVNTSVLNKPLIISTQSAFAT